MSTPLRQQLLLVLAAGLIFFINLGAAQLWDDDEPKNAQCAREMLARGDWVVPTFNGELRPDKPVLIYWLMMSAYQTFGDDEFAARFWSAVAAVGTTLATYHIGRTLLGPRVGLWSGWILASSLMFVVAGRAATPDSLTILCSTLAMLAFVRATWGANTTLAGANRLSDFVPRSRWGMAPVYACMALGVLAKGPVALVLPTLVLVVYLVVVRARLNEVRGSAFESSLALQPCGTAALGCEIAGNAAFSQPRAAVPHGAAFSTFLHLVSPAAWCVAGWKLRPLMAVLMLALIALPWYATVGFATGGEWLSGFLGRHNVGRFLATLENHRGPFFYYIPAIAFGFFPWTILLPQALVRAVRQSRERGVTFFAAYLFLLCWSAVWIVFFSFSSTKLPSYVTPAYPALAIITATWIESWLTAPENVSRWLLRQSMASLVVVGIAAAAALPIIAAYLLPGEAVLAIVGLVLVVGGSLGLCWAVRWPQRAAATLALTSLAFIVSLFGFAAVRVSRHQNSASIVSGLRGQHPQLAAFDFAVPGLVYYSHAAVPQLKHAEQVIRHLKRSPDALVVTHARGYEKLRLLLPANVKIVQREQRFLRRSDVFVLGAIGGNVLGRTNDGTVTPPEQIRTARAPKQP